MSGPHRILPLLTAGYWLLLFVTTHLPPSRLPRTRINDKVEHLVSYAILAGLLFITLRRAGTRSSKKMAARVIIICLAYGAIDEWTQALPFIRRTCSLNDWLADAGGTILATVICWGIVRLLDRRQIGTLH